MTGTRLKKLLLGNHPFIPSHSEYKRVVLTGQLGLLTIIVCLIFISIDVALHRYHALFLHIGCFILSVGAVLLNRSGKHWLSKVVLVLATNITVYLFATSEPMEIGLYLFFIAINLGTVAVFGYVQRKTAFIFICFSVFLFMMFLLSDFSPFGRTPGDEVYVKLNIFVNFILSLLASTVIIVFLINLNFR